MRLHTLLPIAVVACVGCTSPGDATDPPGELSACGNTAPGTFVLAELGFNGRAWMEGDRLVMIGGDGRLSRLDPCTGDAVLLTSMEVGPTAAIGGGFVYTPSVDSVWRVPLELGNTTLVTPSPPSSYVKQGVDQALLIETAPPAGLIRATRLDDQQVLFERGDQLEGKLVTLQTQGTNGLYLSVQNQEPPPLPDAPVVRVPWTIMRVPVGAAEPVAVPGAEAVFYVDAVGDTLFIAEGGGTGWQIARIDANGSEKVVVPNSSDLKDLTELSASEDVVCWRSADDAILCRRLEEGSQTVRISAPTDQPGYGIFIDGDVYWPRMHTANTPQTNLMRTVLPE